MYNLKFYKNIECNTCGSNITKKDMFCPYCGIKIDECIYYYELGQNYYKLLKRYIKGQYGFEREIKNLVNNKKFKKKLRHNAYKIILFLLIYNLTIISIGLFFFNIN